MFLANPHARRQDYDPALKSILNVERGAQDRRWLSGWCQLSPTRTPLRDLPLLARRLALRQINVKDESLRSPLGSFKALGAPIALVRLLRRCWPNEDWQAADLLAGVHAAALRDVVVISATDGNHGRALAAAAQSTGCRCVIVLHAQVSAEREEPIRHLGAEIVRVAGQYDDTVEEAARLAQAHGWQVVSDTSYEGYEDIPRDVMQGYGIIVDEVLEQATCVDRPYTHVVLQGGVGGLAAGIVSHFWERHGASRPSFIVVEPEQADCLLQSARQGEASRASGTVDSVMAGLACGATSPLAWRFLKPTVDYFMTIADAQAEDAMRLLAAGSAGDVPIVSGESGAAGLAALIALTADPGRAESVGLNGDARVLLINTEGATAPGVYASIVGRTADAVLAAQAAWSAAVP